MSLDVRHDESGRRFIAVIEDEEAVIEYRRPDAATIDLYRTYVPEAGRGKGVAGALLAAALGHARAEGLRVIPTCAYAARYFERHPEDASLLAT